MCIRDRYLVDYLTKEKQIAQLIDAKEVNLPFLDKMYKEYPEGESPEVMHQVAQQLHQAHAFILVTPEYNYGLPAALKNLLDHYQKEYLYKACGIVSYSAGSFGGTRAAIHARTVMSELGTLVIPRELPVPKIWQAFDTDGKLLDDAYERRTRTFVNELIWYTEALEHQKTKGLPLK